MHHVVDQNRDEFKTPTFTSAVDEANAEFGDWVAEAGLMIWLSSLE